MLQTAGEHAAVPAEQHRVLEVDQQRVLQRLLDQLAVADVPVDCAREGAMADFGGV